MCEVTRILGKIEAGDPSAAEQLLPLVYDELRKLAAAKMAQEKPDQTLQATALVHEAYIAAGGGESAAVLGQPPPFLCGCGGSHAAHSRGKRARRRSVKHGGQRRAGRSG